MAEKSQLIVRVDPELKKKVQYQAQSEGKTTSDVVRELLTEYLRDRDLVSYVDDLFDQMGVQARAAGLVQEDVDRVIHEFRAERRAGRD